MNHSLPCTLECLLAELGGGQRAAHDTEDAAHDVERMMCSGVLMRPVDLCPQLYDRRG